MSYQKVFDPIVSRLAQSGRFGAALAESYAEVNEFAQTDFARHACLDSPNEWGLEISAGGNIGVGYRQGLEIALHDDNVVLNCLNQVEFSPQFGISAHVTLIRHFGDCHADGQNLEETLFAEIGAGVALPVGVSGGPGISYTAGLSDGLVNRAVPKFVSGTVGNLLDAVHSVLSGKPVIEPVEDAERQAAVCDALRSMMADHQVVSDRDLRGLIVGEFLSDYLRINTSCEDATGNVIRFADDGHDDHHQDDGHDWTVCSDVTLKGLIAAVRHVIQDQLEVRTGALERFAFKQLDTNLGLLDDVFNGCDHLEFNLSAGIGVASPIEIGIGLESHNHYGVIEFAGTDEDLGMLLAESFDAVAAERSPCEAPFWLTFVPFVTDEGYCQVMNVIKSSFAFAEALAADERFTLVLADSFDLFGFRVPLPASPLQNYAMTCGLGPMRNFFNFIWASE